MRKFFHSLRRLAADYRYAMCRLNEIEFSAPWAQHKSRCR
jgi:hypothetical protein